MYPKTQIYFLLVSGGLFVFLLVSCGKSGYTPADVVFMGGKIATVDSGFSIHEAVAVRGDRIVFVGNDEEAEKYIGRRTRVIELAGRLVIPGLIDAHGHMLGLGNMLSEIDLRGTKSIEQIASIVAEAAKNKSPGEWITGRNWDQNLFETTEMPTHEEISRAAPDNPVWLVRVDGHAGLANRKAMELSGIAHGTLSPSGGEILLLKNGEPSGVFVNRAMPLVSSNIPEKTLGQIEEALAAAANHCIGFGLTGVHDAGVSPQIIEAYKRLIDSGELNVRIYAMLSDTREPDIEGYLNRNRVEGYGGNFLEVRSIKMFIDGALGSRGAALFADYSDRQGHTGFLTTSPEHLLEVSRAALKTGFQVITHAIGDYGTHVVLNTYEKAFKENPSNDHRFRIEHAQVVALEDIPRFSQLGILPSMQPTHATSDMPWAESRIGPQRARGAYAWRKFLEEGSIIPCGSDFPVEECNPFPGLYAAVTRQNLEGRPENGWYPDQVMTREEALRGFTIWAAKAAFQEDIIGSIEVGKLADLVVLSDDYLTVPVGEIPYIMPDYVFVGGEVKYTRSTR